LSIQLVGDIIYTEALLDRIQDAVVIRLIERIGDHYRANISNRFLRPSLLQLPLDKMTWDQIELLTEKLELFRYQGFHFYELYRQIVASSRFVSVARNEMPSLRARLGGSTGPDRVLRDMAINNFASNLQLFADLLNELYVNLVKLDQAAAKGRMPVYKQMPELNDIGRFLIGN
jgi:hypothetical protein